MESEKLSSLLENGKLVQGKRDLIVSDFNNSTSERMDLVYYLSGEILAKFALFSLKQEESSLNEKEFNKINRRGNLEKNFLFYLNSKNQPLEIYSFELGKIIYSKKD